MKFHSGTHSGTTVSGLETVNFLVIEKRGRAEIKHARIQKQRLCSQVNTLLLPIDKE
ncbi:MAG: hypothetical protein KGI02_09735 [Thaumarchaeota archaeon]|nr:hypothetical protein [Nitrososphaerota archaeon]MDE1832629.1 hypothetical protein [Nitrososphaerota archaeon]MDE1878582.1 hypothetical protein [Nitrososphaerota archaeon]